MLNDDHVTARGQVRQQTIAKIVPYSPYTIFLWAPSTIFTKGSKTISVIQLE